MPKRITVRMQQPQRQPLLQKGSNFFRPAISPQKPPSKSRASRRSISRSLTREINSITTDNSKYWNAGKPNSKSRSCSRRNSQTIDFNASLYSADEHDAVKIVVAVDSTNDTNTVANQHQIDSSLSLSNDRKSLADCSLRVDNDIPQTSEMRALTFFHENYIFMRMMQPNAPAPVVTGRSVVAASWTSSSSDSELSFHITMSQRESRTTEQQNQPLQSPRKASPSPSLSKSPAKGVRDICCKCGKDISAKWMKNHQQSNACKAISGKRIPGKPVSKPASKPTAVPKPAATKSKTKKGVIKPIKKQQHQKPLPHGTKLNQLPLGKVKCEICGSIV